MTNQTNFVQQLKALKQTAIKQFSKKIESSKNIPQNLTTNQIIKAATQSDFSGLTEGSPQFWVAYNYTAQFNNLVREKILVILDKKDLPLKDFDKTLIRGITHLSQLYVAYFAKWLKALISSPTSTFIKKSLQENKAKTINQVKKLGFDNAYTIIHPKDKNATVVKSFTELTHSAYRTYLDAELTPIVTKCQSLINDLQKLQQNDNQQLVIDNLIAYHDSMNETNIDLLEEKGLALDKAWMKNNYWLQIVHDIETDYADPLGFKIIPDLSLRFPDNNQDIPSQKIDLPHKSLIKYYQGKKTIISKKYLPALENSQAMFCFIPFNTGMSMFFKFSGQSIPNRSIIREQQGVKIFLDYYATQDRGKKAINLLHKVVKNAPDLEKLCDVPNYMLFHVIPHEFGHPIYGYSTFSTTLDNDLITDMEESRADQNAYANLYFLFRDGHLSSKDLVSAAVTSITFALRRFTTWDSSAIYPYKLSEMNTLRFMQDLQIITLDGKNITIDLNPSKIEQFFKQSATMLEQVHNWMDEGNNTKLREIYELNQQFMNSDLCKVILKKVE